MKKIKSGGVEKYIKACPKETRDRLQDLRSAIINVAPDAIETVSYFDMPGYSYEGYEYNGMFAWFSFKAPFVRLHVRPMAITALQKELEKYTHTKAIVFFPVDKPLPKTLVKKLVKASLKDMVKAGK